MGYGLLDIANQSRREALQGISDADRRREEIEASNKMMAAQQKAQHKQNIGTGIGSGAAVGAAVGGLPGAAIGAVIGGLAG
ncbi:bacteriocin, partial [Escherichia coli]|nr:bacteriocin [Escherichia coli]